MSSAPAANRVAFPEYDLGASLRHVARLVKAGVGCASRPSTTATGTGTPGSTGRARMLPMGGGVVGGRVHGAWPGLDPELRLDGDLPASNDYRGVLAELLERRCGIDGRSVFPGLGSARLGVARVSLT